MDEEKEEKARREGRFDVFNALIPSEKQQRAEKRRAIVSSLIRVPHCDLNTLSSILFLTFSLSLLHHTSNDEERIYCSPTV